MIQTIGDITQIRTGLFTQPTVEGDLVYLQAKHFDDFGQLKRALHPDLNSADVTSKHLLKPGEVLFAAKGSKNFASVFELHNPPAVASTSFLVLTITEESILPDYLAWFLNNPSTQSLLKVKAIGTSMVSIPKSTLEELEIPVPDIETQKAVVAIAKLRNEEKRLKHDIEVLREKQIQQQILNAINNHNG